MKIFGNIGPFFRLIRTLKKQNRHLRQVEAARAAGETETEKALIGSAVKEWIADVERIYDLHFVVTGREKIPEETCAFYCNHQSYADIVAMMSAMDGRQIGFIAKEELGKVPYVGKWILGTRGMLIQRGDSRKSLETIRQGIQYLQEGFNLCIFPEGTRSKGGPMKAFKPGSFKLATKAKVPIVPVTLEGGYRVFEETGTLTKGITVQVVFHDPIPTADKDRAQLAQIHTQVENIIRETLEKLRG